MSALSDWLTFVSNLDLYWKIAGIAGLGLAVLLGVYSRLLRSQTFDSLNDVQKTRLLALMIAIVGVAAIAAILVWRPQPFVVGPRDIALESPIPSSGGLPSTGSPFAPVKTSCRIDVGNSGKTGIELAVGEIVCKELPDATLEVSYIWVNLQTYNALAWGVDEKWIERVFGKGPVLISNDVYDAIERLQEKYGSVLDRPGSGNFLSVESPIGDKSYRDAKWDSTAADPKFKGPYFSLTYPQEFLFPDIRAMEELIDTQLWLRGYKLDFRPQRRCYGRWVTELDCPIVWRDPDSSELRSFASEMQRYFEKFFDEEREWNIPSQTNSAQRPKTIGEYGRVRSDLATWPQRSVDMVLDLAGNQIPSGFVSLIAEMSQSMHNPEEYGWSINLHVPAVRVMMMTLKVRGEGRALEVAALDQLTSAKTDLRAGGSIMPSETSVQRLPLDVLDSTRTLVIPLKVEFVPEAFEHWSTKGPSALVLKEENARTQRLQREWREKGVVYIRTFTKSTIASDVEVAPLNMRPFNYGPEHVIKTLKLKDGREIALRQFDPNLVMIENGDGKGSCPFVEVRRTGGRGWRKVKQILVGAVGPDREEAEQVLIDGDVSGIQISEHEAERSHLRSVIIEGRRSNESKWKELFRSNNVFLNYGETLSVDLSAPKFQRYKHFRLNVRGYYEPYEAKVANR